MGQLIYDENDRKYQIIDPIEVDERGRQTFFCSKFKIRMYISKFTGQPYFYNEKREVCDELEENDELGRLRFFNSGDDFDPDDPKEFIPTPA